MSYRSTEAHRPQAERVIVPQSSHGWLTYETFYGLNEKPFELSSDPTFFYKSRSHTTAFETLLAGIRRRESLGVISGDIGTGKTTLCRTVLTDLDRQTFSAFVPDPFATREDLLKIVLADFGVVSAADLASGRLRGASRTELSYLLYEFLATLAPLQAFAVVFVDEAQNLSLPLLEEIRILSDSDGRQRQLQVVLIGQLELHDKLRLPEMRQVAQRVSRRCTLEPLDRDDVAGYIEHRLCVAGGTPDRIRFSHEAIDAIYEVSAGVPRLVNRLCDRALHHGALRCVNVIDDSTLALVAEEAGPLSAAAQSVVVSDLPKSAERRKADIFEMALPRPTTEKPDVIEAADAWFAGFDARVKQSELDVRVTSADGATAVPPMHAPHRSHAIPLTHMQTVQRTWFRRLKFAALLLAILGGARFVLMFAVSLLGLPTFPTPY